MFEIGDKVRLTDSGFNKMVIRGFKIETPGTVVGLDTNGSPVIIYVEFPGILRSDGKKRFGFVDGDMTITRDVK